MTPKYKHSELTSAIINAFYVVYNTLGYGFLEKVYEKALIHELTKRGFQVAAQVPIKVYYDGVIVGEYFADLIVNDILIIELKTTEFISDAHKAQLINYLKATGKEIGLILNFGPEPQISRKVN
ncbi:MAG: GxxExxY protein [Anaerolineales bacterium]